MHPALIKLNCTCTSIVPYGLHFFAVTWNAEIVSSPFPKTACIMFTYNCIRVPTNSMTFIVLVALLEQVDSNGGDDGQQTLSG